MVHKQSVMSALPPKSGHVGVTGMSAECQKRTFARHQYSSFVEDSVSANSRWCSGRDRRSPPLNLGFHRR